MKRTLRHLILLVLAVIAVFAMSSIAYGATSLSGKTTISLYGSEYSYTGSPIVPKLYVYYKSPNSYITRTLEENKDYTVQCSDNINVGTATVTITGMGEYEGTVSKTFSITKRSISGYEVKISVADATYTGYNITPKITAALNGKTLTEGVDYTVDAVSAKDAGSQRITIRGKGNFDGSTTEYFRINKKPLSECRVSVSDQKYTGKALTPSVTVYNGSLAVPSSEYRVSYSDNTQIGTAKVEVEAMYSASNYTGETTATFLIKYDIAKCTFTISKCTYTGSAVTPEVTIRQGSKTLTKGVDYLLHISNNINAGQGSITVTGTGYYLGSAAKTFTIEPKSIETALSTLVLPEEKYIYTGQKFVPEVTSVMDGTTALVKEKDYTITYEKNKNPGYAYAVINGKGNYGKAQKLKFAIYPSAPKILKIEPDTKNTAVIKWAKGPKGLKYIVYRNGNNIGTSKTNAVSFKDKKAKTNGKDYEYTIVAICSNAGDLKSEMSEAKVSRYIKAPKVSASVAGSRVLMAKWNKVKDVDGYQLQMSTSKKFTKKKTYTIKNGATVKKVLAGLTAGRKYYFRVRAYKTIKDEETKVKYYSSWSNTAVKAPITASAHSSAV